MRCCALPYVHLPPVIPALVHDLTLFALLRQILR